MEAVGQVPVTLRKEVPGFVMNRMQIAAVNEAVKGEDAEDIRAKTETLQSAFHKVSEAMYERAQAEQQAGAAASGDGAGAASGSDNGASADEEEVVDAEVVDEQK